MNVQSRLPSVTVTMAPTVTSTVLPLSWSDRYTPAPVVETGMVVTVPVDRATVDVGGTKDGDVTAGRAVAAPVDGEPIDAAVPATVVDVGGKVVEEIASVAVRDETTAVPEEQATAVKRTPSNQSRVRATWREIVPSASFH